MVVGALNWFTLVTVMNVEDEFGGRVAPLVSELLVDFSMEHYYNDLITRK